MANTRALTATQEKKMVAMYVEQKQGVGRVADELGVHPSTVLAALRRLNVVVRPRGKGGLRKATTKTVQRAVQLYVAGEGCEDVAAQFDVSAGTVLRWVREAGEDVRPAGFPSGEDHPGWNGGRSIRPDGYVCVLVDPEDPFYVMAQSKFGEVRYALEHRLVMAKRLGRPLRRDETVHHIDGNRQNNDIKNLQLRQGRHGKGVVFRCADCGSHDIESLPIS